MDQGCTPALTGIHSDVWSFSRTLWDQLLKKLSMFSILNISPWYQTLPKAFDMSKNTQWSIKSFVKVMNNYNSWFKHESLDRKPHWWTDNSFLFLLFQIFFHKLVTMILSVITNNVFVTFFMNREDVRLFPNIREHTLIYTVVECD